MTHVAKVVHLRVSVGPENTMKMAEYVSLLKEVLTQPIMVTEDSENVTIGPVAKNVTAMGEEYIVDGQQVKVDDYENPKPKKAGKGRKSKSKDEEAVRQLAGQVGTDATGSLGEDPRETYNPNATPLQFHPDVDAEVVDYLRDQDAEKVVSYRQKGMTDAQVAATLRELESMSS